MAEQPDAVVSADHHKDNRGEKRSLAFAIAAANESVFQNGQGEHHGSDGPVFAGDALAVVISDGQAFRIITVYPFRSFAALPVPVFLFSYMTILQIQQMICIDSRSAL